MLVSDNLEMVASEMMTFGMALGEKSCVERGSAQIHSYASTLSQIKSYCGVGFLFCLFSWFY